jgi:hypothetical protein
VDLAMFPLLFAIFFILTYFGGKYYPFEKNIAFYGRGF